jgi:PAS domain S-box-containing protein
MSNGDHETIALERMGCDEARRYTESIIDSMREVLVVLDESLRVVSANRAFYRHYRISPPETHGRLFDELAEHRWAVPRLRHLLERLRDTGAAFDDFLVEQCFEHIGERVLLLSARPLSRHDDEPPRILVEIEDVTDRYGDRRRLEESETKYRTLVEDINSIIIGFDRHGCITFFNSFSEKLFGYSREEVFGKPFVGTILPSVDSRGVDNTPIEREIFTDPAKYYANESEGVRKDGSRIWFTWNSKAIRDSTGAVCEILIDGNDITELALTRRTLDERSATLEATINSLPNGYVVFSESGALVRINEIARQVLGVAYGEGEQLRADRFDTLDVRSASGEPYPRERFPAIRALYGETIRDEIVNVVGPMGSRWLSVSASPIITDGFEMRGAVMELVDITALHELQEQLAAERNFMAAILQTSGALIAVLDRDGHFVRVNRACEQLTGYTAEEVIGRSVFELFIPPGEREEVDQIVARLRAGDSDIVHEHHWRTRSGNTRFFRWHYTLLGTRTGGTGYYIKTGMDITDRKILEENCRNRSRELAAVNRELETFSYSVSHDLRAPLRTVKEFSRFLLDDYRKELDEDGRHLIERIAAGADAMNALIEDMLSLSRVSRQEMALQEVDLSAVVEEIVTELRDAYPDRRVELFVQEGVRAHADLRQIRLALANLLRNAWKFTATRQVARIEFGAVRHGTERVFYLRDNGVGFDTRFAEMIFEPFKRVHAERDFGGTGVGLSIVQRVIIRHGGRVWAEGEVDKGATFYFTLRPHSE